MSLRLRLTLLYSTLMGGILLVISAAVIIVITALLFNTIDNRLETAQGIILSKPKIEVNDLGKVELRLKSADISSDVYVQVWGWMESCNQVLGYQIILQVNRLIPMLYTLAGQVMTISLAQLGISVC